MSKSALKKNRIDDKTLLIFSGPTLDNDNAAEMSVAIENAQKDGCLDIRIDMSEIELLSSAGIGSILGSVELSRSRGGDITLWNPSERATAVLEILDLDEYMTIKSGAAEVGQT